MNTKAVTNSNESSNKINTEKVTNPLENRYEEYLDLLETLCEYFDQDDKEILALPISTAIRVLVHDTNRVNSTSLLEHLNKKGIKFLSTNNELKDNRVHLGLVRQEHIGVIDGYGGTVKHRPSERYHPMPEDKKFIEFEEWWEKEKIFASSESALTRKDLVLAVANKDGGAHFDKEVDKKYDDCRHSYSGGTYFVDINSRKKTGYDNIPTYPAIRQIAYELLYSLRHEQSDK